LRELLREERETASLSRGIFYWLSALVTIVSGFIGILTIPTNVPIFSIALIVVAIVGIWVLWYRELQREKSYANAWIKSFNKNYPNSGLMRIWDFDPHYITDQMLDDLYNVSTSALSQ
jgi:type III secretory pathway component EscR